MKEDKKILTVCLPMETFEAVESLRWNLRQNRSQFVNKAIELHVRRMKRMMERANEQSSESK